MVWCFFSCAFDWWLYWCGFLLSFSIRDNKKQLNISTSSEYPDYSSLKDLKKLVIVENFQSWTPNSDPKTFKSIERMILEKGNITKGYIYVKTSINNKAFSSWESIYMKMNDNGGHLFRPNSLPVPKSDKTELLFALNNIFYLPSIPYSETKTPKKN